MGHQVSKWIADDGTEFNEKKLMLLHEMALIDGKEIALFLAKQNISSRRMTEYTKLLVSWQKYMREYSVTNVVDENDPPVESKDWKPVDYAFSDEAIEEDIFAGATHI